MRITYNPYGFGWVIFVVVVPVESIWKHICQHDQTIQSAEVCFKIQAKLNHPFFELQIRSHGVFSITDLFINSLL